MELVHLTRCKILRRHEAGYKNKIWGNHIQSREAIDAENIVYAMSIGAMRGG
jgi:hypothetical protein